MIRRSGASLDHPRFETCRVGLANEIIDAGAIVLAAGIVPNGGRYCHSGRARFKTFVSETEHGGHDGDEPRPRYLSLIGDPGPGDGTDTVDDARLLRDRDGSTRVAHDRRVEPLFSRGRRLRGGTPSS